MDREQQRCVIRRGGVPTIRIRRTKEPDGQLVSCSDGLDWLEAAEAPTALGGGRGRLWEGGIGDAVTPGSSVRRVEQAGVARRDPCGEELVVDPTLAEIVGVGLAGAAAPSSAA